MGRIGHVFYLWERDTCDLVYGTASCRDVGRVFDKAKSQNWSHNQTDGGGDSDREIGDLFGWLQVFWGYRIWVCSIRPNLRVMFESVVD